MPRDYSASNWYWRVTGRNDVYHSARFAYVALNDSQYLAFLADGNLATTIDTEASLRDVLNEQGVLFLTEVLPPVTEIRPRVIRARCRLQIASFSVPHATGTAAPFDVELVDPLNMHANSPNPDRIVIPETGWYFGLGGARFLESSAGAPGVPNTGLRAVQLRIGAGTVIATSRHAPAPQDNSEFQAADYFQANAGDILRLFVEQRCGGSMNVAARVNVFRVE